MILWCVKLSALVTISMRINYLLVFGLKPLPIEVGVPSCPIVERVKELNSQNLSVRAASVASSLKLKLGHFVDLVHWHPHIKPVWFIIVILIVMKTIICEKFWVHPILIVIGFCREYTSKV